MIDDPGEVSGLLGQIAVRRDDRVAGFKPRMLGGGAGMNSDYLDPTAGCITHRFLIDAETGQGKE